MNLWRRLYPYLRTYRISLIVGGLCLLLGTPCQLFHPLVWKFVVDDVIDKDRMDLLLPALLVMLAVHVIGTGLSSVRTYILGCVGQRFIFDLRNDVYQKLQSQSMAYFHEHRSGDLLSRVMSDIDALEEIVIQGVDSIIANFLSFLYVSAIIIYLQWVVGLVTIIPLLVVGVFIYLFNMRVKTLYREVRAKLGAVSAKLHENLVGMPVIKAFARDDEELARFRRENAAYREAGIKGVRARAIYFPSLLTVGFFSNLIMIGLGAIFVMRGEFTLGGLVAYRGYWWQLFSPVHTLGQINEMFQRAVAAGNRVFELLDEPVSVSDADDAQALTNSDGRIAFEGVSFAYTNRLPVLDNIDLSIERGETVGVVGPSGAGKSTMLNLLLRFHDPTAGRITIVGQDLRSLQQVSLRQHVGIVTQEPFLFNISIRENIRYGRLDATDSAIIQAAESANAHEFIAELPEGYDTLIGERGVKLSGGQRQRVCIARAFLENPPILLLDEATAAVEPESEQMIQAALQRLMAGRTTIIVSHRLSMVRDADQIIVVEGGRLAERGRHDQLMAQGGWYARMYRLQMAGEAND